MGSSKVCVCVCVCVCMCDTGPGTIEEVWDNGSWVRVKWDMTGETGCYWIASMWTCLPHNTG